MITSLRTRRALVLIGLVPLAYKTHELERALPDLAQRAQELQVDRWSLVVPVAILLTLSIWLFRRLWDGLHIWSIVYAFCCWGQYWLAVSKLQLGAPPPKGGWSQVTFMALILLAMGIGNWLVEKKWGPLDSDASKSEDARPVADQSLASSPPLSMTTKQNVEKESQKA
ncbi:MAG: hypothetical protein K1X67_09980 [Fimbriimonadaceae bacterium]|nr:hypothetical protein [Fimbriimonadaceae bacterium]